MKPKTLIYAAIGFLAVKVGRRFAKNKARKSLRWSH